MNLSYNRRTNRWFHSQKGRILVFGSGGEKVFYGREKGHLSFSVRETEGKAGPVIGILVYQKKGKWVFNRSFVNSLAERLIKRNLLPVLIPVERMKEGWIDGAVYDKRKRAWMKASLPLPDVIYNRISAREREKTDSFKEAIRFFKSRNIPFFNPRFLNKFETYRIVHEHPHLRSLLPETILIQNRKQLLTFFEKWKTIYIKPNDKREGTGVFVMKWLKTGYVAVRTPRSKTLYKSFSDFWKTKGRKLSKQPHIAQQAIFPVKKNGKRYDFRVLAVFGSGKYELVGIGVREAGAHNVTTHVSKGGRLLSFESVASENEKMELVRIIRTIGNLLAERVGFLGEFSADIGMAKNGELKLFEINSKPMTFDEGDIEDRRLEALCHLFLQIAGF